MIKWPSWKQNISVIKLTRYSNAAVYVWISFYVNNEKMAFRKYENIDKVNHSSLCLLI